MIVNTYILIEQLLWARESLQITCINKTIISQTYILFKASKIILTILIALVLPLFNISAILVWLRWKCYDYNKKLISNNKNSYLDCNKKRYEKYIL